MNNDGDTKVDVAALRDIDFPICETFQYDVDDFVRGVFASRNPVKLYGFFIVLFLVCFGYLFWLDKALTVYGAIAGAAIAFATFRAVFARASVRKNIQRQFVDNRIFETDTRFEISEHGFRIVTEFEDATMRWTGVGKYKDVGDIIIVFRNKKVFNVVPVYKFSEQGRVAFRHFLQQNVRS